MDDGNLRKWLTRILELLGNEGRLLLKLLHYGRIPWGKLDAIQSPAELYTATVLSPEVTSSSSSSQLTPTDDYVTPTQFLSTMIYWLSILKGPDLGGERCIQALDDYSLPEPSTLVPAAAIDYPSREAELMECLVTAYVRMKVDERKRLLTYLGERHLNLHADHASVYAVFSKLFQDDKISTEEEPEVFISALKSAGAPQESFQAIVSYLDKYGIPHSDPQASIGT